MDTEGAVWTVHINEVSGVCIQEDLGIYHLLLAWGGLVICVCVCVCVCVCEGNIFWYLWRGEGHTFLVISLNSK